MHDLDVISRLNEEAVQRARLSVPDGATHLVTRRTGVNVHSTVYANSEAEAKQTAEAHEAAAPGNTAKIELVPQTT